jgi:hypothetical protein
MNHKSIIKGLQVNYKSITNQLQVIYKWTTSKLQVDSGCISSIINLKWMKFIYDDGGNDDVDNDIHDNTLHTFAL